MNKEEIEQIIHDYLKKNLRIELDYDFNDYGRQYINVDTYLGKELIYSSDNVTID